MKVGIFYDQEIPYEGTRPDKEFPYFYSRSFRLGLLTLPKTLDNTSRKSENLIDKLFLMIGNRRGPISG